MRIVDWKHELPEDAEPGERVKVGRGSWWCVYKFNAHSNVWVSQYWAYGS